MRTSCQLLLAFVSLLLLSCSNDTDTVLTFDAESEHIISRNLEFSADGGEADLYFTTNKEVQPVISYGNSSRREPEWLWAEGIVSRGKGRIIVYCDENDAFQSREATLYVSVDDASFTVKVVQSPKSMVSITRKDYVVGPKKQTLDIELITNGKLTFSQRFDQPSWMDYMVSEAGNNKVKLQLSVAANEKWGRVAFVDIYVNGMKHTTLSIRQQPAAFASEVEMPAVKAGSLFVLLGDEETNLRRIRSLTLGGSLNALDLHVLKQRLFLSGRIAQSYPLALDMYQAHIYEDAHFPYSGLEIDCPDHLSYIVDNCLRPDLFEGVENLVSLKLPAYLKGIAERSFAGCRGLKQISIPSEVTVIGGWAFHSCSALEEVVIPPYSRLTSLGDYVFATLSQMKSLYLPGRLTGVSELTFRSCHVETLRVDWETPPLWVSVPQGEVLSVPAGSKSLYESAPLWKEFTSIIEHEAE